MQAKGHYEEDFQEAFQRYTSRSEVEALRAQLQAHQAEGERSAGGAENPGEWSGLTLRTL
jgi:hypothetical protein